MSVRPVGHPAIPTEVAPEDVIAIVSIHDPQASNANRDTPFRKTRLSSKRANGTSRRTNEGCHIFLHRIDGQPCFTFGRGDSKTPDSSKPGTRDVYFPGTMSGVRQFVMTPIWDSDIWRLHSASEIVATVNGVPVQACTARTKQYMDPLPQAVHFQQTSVNNIMIKDLRIDIWLLKSVREVYPTKPFVPQPLKKYLQDVSHRQETWARDRYILGREQVSTHSYRVVERFTGKVRIAKLFRDPQRGRQFRDAEFLRFNRKEVDVSVVQYLQSIDIDSIPAVITAAHEGFASYAALQADIKKQHPGVRFSIATKLLRRVFSALEFLHFHSIIHSQISQDSVLLRLVDYKAESVLLVDYSNSTSFTTGMPAPTEEMVEDGQAAMQVIEDCCDIWQLRKAATKDAMNEEWMAKKTMEAQKQYQIVQRVVADFDLKSEPRTSEKGKKLLRLLDQKNNNWHSCQSEQVHNATRREIGSCFKSNIDEMVKDWERGHSPFNVGEKVYMNLSLGHPWFDNLANQLYCERWDTTPGEVCAKFKELAGDVEDPWQKFEVKTTMTIQQSDAGLDEKCVLAWLAGYCEAYPEWRSALETQCEHHLRPRNGTVPLQDIGRLRDALATYGRLPSPMAATFNRLMAQGNNSHTSIRIEETHHVSFHVPSRMFNLTQLHRLASADRFVICVNDGRIRCDNYVEVRGEPELQGCYAPLSLLSAFASELDLIVPQVPDHTPIFPNFDPSDFSQAPAGKIVLARTGLAGFASVTRTGDQFVFYAPKFPKGFETRNTFLATYFGDMPVLPHLSEGVHEYFRPEHWSKFKTAEEIEGAANVGKRRILEPKGPSQRLSTKKRTESRTSSRMLSTVMEVDEPALSQMLKQREHVRSQARFPLKRNTGAQSSNPSTPTAKRSRSSVHTITSRPPQTASNITMSFVNRAAERMEQMAQAKGSPTAKSSASSIPRIPNSSFFQRNANVNANVLSSPPRVPIDPKQSFTIPSGSFNLDDDWKQAEQWLEQMPDDSDEEPHLEGLFGYRFHHSHLQSSNETEEDTSSGDKAKGISKRKTPSRSFAATKTATRMPRRKEKAVSRSFANGSQSSFPTAELPTRSQSFSGRLQPFAATVGVRLTPEGKVMGGKQTPLMSPFQSFGRPPNPQVVTPTLTSPAVHARPAVAPAATSLDLGMGHHPNDVSIIDLADISRVRMQPQATTPNPAQPPSPSETTNPSILAKHAAHGPAHLTPSTPIQTTQLPGIQNGIYSNPNGAIQGWFNDQEAAHDGDEDMPDTDAESWEEDDQLEA